MKFNPRDLPKMANLANFTPALTRHTFSVRQSLYFSMRLSSANASVRARRPLSTIHEYWSISTKTQHFGHIENLEQKWGFY